MRVLLFLMGEFGANRRKCAFERGISGSFGVKSRGDSPKKSGVFAPSAFARRE